MTSDERQGEPRGRDEQAGGSGQTERRGSGAGDLARRLCVRVVPLLVVALCGWFGSRVPYVAQGGDAPAYLLAARYDPLVDNFDNPSHTWGFPALVKLLTPLAGDEYAAARVVSALAAGLLVFVAAALAFRFLPALYATLATLVAASLPAVLIAGSAAMSDALFAALAGLSIWCAVGVRPGWRSAAGAGALAVLALFVRGNGIALLLLLPPALLLLRRGARDALACLAGATAVLALGALLFRSQGVPPGRMLPSGAAELAFATLDNSGTWNERLAYEERYPGYGAVLREHLPEVARAALKTLYHLHDWWLLPSLSLLGLLTLPGLLWWIRRPCRTRLAVALLFLGVQATYLWSGRFAQPRHVLACVPFLVTASLAGVLLLPRAVRLGPRALRPRRAGLPVRAPVAVLVAALTMGAGAAQLSGHARFDPRSGLVQDLTDAGLWLSGQAAPGEQVAASRLNIAYYAGLWPVNFTDLFAAGYPDREQLAARLAGARCAWLAWIDGHSEKAFGPLAWLAQSGDFPGAQLVYREGAVSLWRVDGAATTH